MISIRWTTIALIALFALARPGNLLAQGHGHGKGKHHDKEHGKKEHHDHDDDHDDDDDDDEREDHHEHHKNGPPPWAPAHGYRAKTRYVYFQDHDVYYDHVRGVYISMSGSRWTISAQLPAPLVRVDLRVAPKIDLDFAGDDPYREHEIHVKKYKHHKHDDYHWGPWEPPQHRVRTRYVYFHDHDVYYDHVRGVYLYINGGKWVVSPRVPTPLLKVDLKIAPKVELDFSGENPYRDHEIHIKKYKRR